MSSIPVDEDPFSVFGDDEEEDGNHEEESTIHRDSDMLRMAQSLVRQANNSSSSSRAANNNNTDAVMNTSHSRSTGTDLTKPHGSLKSCLTPNNSALLEIETRDDKKKFHSLVPGWPNPLYLNSNAVLTSDLDRYGGGRGYVASSSISAGTLIMVEEALILWPSPNMIVDLNLISYILQQPNAARIVHAMEHLYPTKFQVDNLNKENQEQCDPLSNNMETSVHFQIMDMINMYKAQISEESTEMRDLIQFALEMNVGNSSNNTRLDRLDILRLLLALRYNSLETGIFLHAAMLNHADIPNCVKFRSSSSSSSSTTTARRRRSENSEVRAIRTIAAGEPLTISYLPRLLSHCTRREHLWNHHRFDIGIPSSEAEDAATALLREMEMIGNRFPPSTTGGGGGTGVVDATVQRRIEKTTMELEDELREIISCGRQRWQSSSSAHHDSTRRMVERMDSSETVRLPPDELERAKVLEVASFQLCETCQEQLQNTKHILLLPCLELHLQACDLILQQDQQEQQRQQQQQTAGLSPTQRRMLLGRVIVTSSHLWQLQELLYGRDYYALAQTLFELAQATEQLLSQQAKYLTNTLCNQVSDDIVMWLRTQHPRGMSGSSLANNISAWTSLEHYARIQHERIKALYPQDADSYIRQQPHQQQHES